MEMQRKIMAMEGGNRLSDLPESILLYILSMLPDGKEVVRTSVLSTRWRSLWISVPVSLDFSFSVGQGEDQDEDDVVDFVTSTHRELHYWSSCQKIQKFRIFFDIHNEIFVRDVNSWVYFATRLANVEDFSLEFQSQYELPQFAYKSTSLRNLVLQSCELKPFDSVNWSSLVSLSVNDLELTEDVMQKVLSGCPKLECLQLEFFTGIHLLEINNVKLRKLTINSFEIDECYDWLEIVAPYIQNLQLLGSCRGIRLRNVPSLVTVVLDLLDLDFGDGHKSKKKESSCLKELLHSLTHVNNLEIGSWCIQCMSTLALEGWQSQPSSGKFLKLNTNLKELDFLGICRFLKSSSHLETLVIDWYNPDLKLQLPFHIKDKDRQSRRFESHKFNCPLLHLKTIKFINLVGPLSENEFVLPLVKYFLENAIVLEKFDIVGRCRGSDMSQVHVKIEQELLRFPRSSPHASVVFSYQPPPVLD